MDGALEFAFATRVLGDSVAGCPRVTLWEILPDQRGAPHGRQKSWQAPGIHAVRCPSYQWGRRQAPSSKCPPPESSNPRASGRLKRTREPPVCVLHGHDQQVLRIKGRVWTLSSSGLLFTECQLCAKQMTSYFSQYCSEESVIYHPHLTDKKTEAPRGPISHRQKERGRARMESRSAWLKGHCCTKTD